MVGEYDKGDELTVRTCAFSQSDRESSSKPSLEDNINLTPKMVLPFKVLLALVASRAS